MFALVIAFGSIVAATPATRALATQDDAEPTEIEEPVAPPPSETVPLRPVRVNPDRGVVGSTFTVSLDGLASGQAVDWHWQTWDGWYSTNPSSETVEYKRREFTERRYPIAQSIADDSGTATATLTAPEDYGEVHLVYAVVDGVDVGRGGYRIQLSASITPSEGPVGTPITIRVTGMAARLFSGSTLAVRWNNAFTGILTATTTGGTAAGRIRAVGPIGQQYVVLGAGTVPPYLNIGQSPYDFVYSHLPNHEDVRLPFRVTSDPGPTPDAVDWPDPTQVASLPANAQRTAASLISVPGIAAELQPASGPVLSRPMLQATGLEPNVDVQMWWVTARGNRVTPSGWSLADIQLPTASAAVDGSLSTQITVPDDLGGWHVLKMAQSGRIVAEAPYFVERSLVDVSPRQVRNGDTVTIHVKGLGWTELDNGFAVTYDNSHIGYACGFNSDGDVVMQVLATGAPGTHLIDLYPMVYAGQDPKAWYWAPILTYAEDFPALGLGYRLPAMRIAIQIL
jgi:hypothetical protein